MFTLPDLPYAYNALEPHIDEQTMRIHHDKHHATYVKNLNDVLSGQDEFLNMDIEALVSDLNKVPEDIRLKVRRNGGQHANHTLFWVSMTPNGGGEPTGKLIEEINNAFGDFNQFKDKFTQAAIARFGSGWAFLVLDGGKLAIMDTENGDNPLMLGKTPLLALDVWEHAYYLKYQNRRPEYINAWWNTVNWEEVDKRFNQANKPNA